MQALSHNSLAYFDLKHLGRVLNSVTRCLDCLFNIGPFITMKICPIGKNICQSLFTKLSISYPSSLFQLARLSFCAILWLTKRFAFKGGIKWPQKWPQYGHADRRYPMLENVKHLSTGFEVIPKCGLLIGRSG